MKPSSAEQIYLYIYICVYNTQQGSFLFRTSSPILASATTPATLLGTVTHPILRLQRSCNADAATHLIPPLQRSWQRFQTLQRTRCYPWNAPPRCNATNHARATLWQSFQTLLQRSCNAPQRCNAANTATATLWATPGSNPGTPERHTL